MERTLLPGLLWASFLLGGSGAAQAPTVQHLIPPGASESRRGSDPEIARLERTLEGLARSFEDESADELDPFLSDRKIYLSLKARGEETGYFGPGQVKAMFSRLFRDRKTDSFTYDPGDIEITGGKRAQFRAKWKYMVLDADEVVTEHLRFELEQVRGDWRISGVRSVPR